MAPWRSVRVEASSQYADLSVRKLLGRYSTFSFRTALISIEHKPAAIEPGIGGRLIHQNDLQAGDIVLATTGNPGDHGIPSQELSSRALICLDNERVIDSTGGTFAETTMALLLGSAQTAAAFRIQLDTEAGQKELGKRLAEHAASKLGTTMTGADKNAGRPAWVRATQPFFTVDRYSFLPEENKHWLGYVDLGVPREEEEAFPFFCSWLFLDALEAAAKAEDGSRLFWFTVDDYIKLKSVRIFQPLGYIGHLKAPS